MKKTKNESGSPKPILLFTWKLCENPRTAVVAITDVRFPKNQNDIDATSFKAASEIDAKRHPLFAALARIKGLEAANSNGIGMELQVDAATVGPSWDVLKPLVIDAIQEHVSPNHQLVEKPLTVSSQVPATKASSRNGSSFRRH